jgi:ankyrin repeat protein
MIRVTPQLLAAFIATFPREARAAAEQDIATLAVVPRLGMDAKLRCAALSEPIGLLEYAIRFGAPQSVDLLLKSGADTNAGVPRPLTLVVMTQSCADDGRIDKLELLLQADAKPGFVETAEHVPPTPLIALARSKITGMQRYWAARALLAAGASVRTANEYEARVLGRLLTELRAIETILDALTPDEQAASKTGLLHFNGLVAAVLSNSSARAFERLIVVKKELRLPVTLDPTDALIGLAQRIADNPVTPSQIDCIKLLLGDGAEIQKLRNGTSAFEACLDFENHELAEVFLEAGAKPERASSPELVFELMRRQGLPQGRKARPAPPIAAPPHKAVNSLDLLCSGIAALEACAPADIASLSTDHADAMQALARRLRAMANRLEPTATTLQRR